MKAHFSLARNEMKLMTSSFQSHDTNSYFWILLLAINALARFQLKLLIQSKMAAVLIFNHEWLKNCTKYSFFQFLATPKVKGIYHMPEICNYTCSDILGGNKNIIPKYLGHRSIIPILALLLHLSPKMGPLTSMKISFLNRI